MDLKDLFRTAKAKAKGRPRRKAEGYSINDLIALGKLDEAREALEKRLKRSPRQHHTRLKLADLLMKQGRGADAVDQYLEVADGYAADGFFDKAHALLAKLSRLLPNEGKLEVKLQRLEAKQELERRRGVINEAVSAGGKIKTHSFSVQHLWTDIVKCSLVRELTQQQLTKLFRLLDVERLAQGDNLVAAGEERNEMFIIVQGEIAAQILLATGKRTDLRAFGAGDIVGEDALLKREAWPAAYIAKKKTSMFKLDRSGLEELLRGEADPRGLLDALRAQGHDAEVAQALSMMSER